MSNRADVDLPAGGTVVLVGAGPGDPGLLPQRAVAALADADVVLIERAGLVPDALLGDGRVREQPVEGGAAAVVAEARAGRRVVRVLPGDGWTEGAGPTEAAACVQAGIPFEVVPGVPTVTAAAAYAGVDLSSAGHACSSVVLDGTRALRGSLDAVAAEAKQLLADGADRAQPVVLVTTATTPDQQTRHTTLAELAESGCGDAAAIALLAPPPEEGLAWFEQRPLVGWHVLVPRTRDDATPLLSRLRGYGAVAEEVPTISVEPPRNANQIERALRGLVEGRYAWVVLTSVNALRAVRDRLEAYGLDSRAMSGVKIAAVGESTVAALHAWGIRPELVPLAEQSSRGLLAEWPPFDAESDPLNRVFLPRADIATETLAAGLVELGWEPEDVTAYRTVRAAPPPAPVRDAIKTGAFDAVVFTSSSTVRNLVGIAGKPHGSTIVACIGPQTAAVVQEHGMRVDVMAASPTPEHLVDALAAFAVARRDELAAGGETGSRPSQRRRSPARRPSARKAT